MKSMSMAPQWRTAMALGSSPGCGAAVGGALLDARPVAGQAVEPARLDVRTKLAALADHRLAGAEHQPTVVGHRPGQGFERQRLLLGAEVEQHVATQDDVEVARMGERLEQIVDLESDRPAQRFGRTPAVGSL